MRFLESHFKGARCYLNCYNLSRNVLINTLSFGLSLLPFEVNGRSSN